MGGTYGVNETLEIADLGFSSYRIGKDILADGKVGLLELPQLIPLIGKVTRAVDNAKLVPKELGELDSEDQAKLLEFFATRLPDITDSAALRLKVNAFLKAGLAIAEAIAVVIAVSRDGLEVAPTEVGGAAV